jgi:L-ascorbate metabolism protein UlaG (beta-lactamase superfamily)
MKIRWFPNSWLVLQHEGRVIYIDPAWVQQHFLRYPGRVIFSRYPQPMDGLPEADLPLADLILITHAHKDHYKETTVDRLSKPETSILAPQALAGKFSIPVSVVRPGDERRIGRDLVRVVPAYNTPEGRSTRKQHRQGRGVGYVLERDGLRLYHAGDTDIIPEMRELGPIDIAFLPVGGTYTMDVKEAAEAAALIKPRKAVAMHFLKADPRQFVLALQAIDPGIEAVVPRVGQVVHDDGT